MTPIALPCPDRMAFPYIEFIGKAICRNETKNSMNIIFLKDDGGYIYYEVKDGAPHLCEIYQQIDDMLDFLCWEIVNSRQREEP